MYNDEEHDYDYEEYNECADCVDEDCDCDYDYHYYCGNDDYNDYERDTFYALTDGMYGDYDEWSENGGDIGSLMDSLGY